MTIGNDQLPEEVAKLLNETRHRVPGRMQPNAHPDDTFRALAARGVKAIITTFSRAGKLAVHVELRGAASPIPGMDPVSASHAARTFTGALGSAVRALNGYYDVARRKLEAERKRAKKRLSDERKKVRSKKGKSR